MFFPLRPGGWSSPSQRRRSQTRRHRRDQRGGIFVYVLIVKLVHFYLYWGSVFVFVFVFSFWVFFLRHVWLSRALWIRWKCTIFFYLAEELFHPQRLQLYIMISPPHPPPSPHLGPKTADRIPIRYFPHLPFVLPFSLLFFFFFFFAFVVQLEKKMMKKKNNKP